MCVHARECVCVCVCVRVRVCVRAVRLLICGSVLKAAPHVEGLGRFAGEGHWTCVKDMDIVS